MKKFFEGHIQDFKDGVINAPTRGQKIWNRIAVGFVTFALLSAVVAGAFFPDRWWFYLLLVVINVCNLGLIITSAGSTARRTRRIQELRGRYGV